MASTNLSTGMVLATGEAVPRSLAEWMRRLQDADTVESATRAAGDLPADDGSGTASSSVVGFGADPAGVLDSTVAIQRALDSNLRALYFPPGVYRISGRLTVSNPDTHIYGYGAKIEQHAANTIAFYVSASRVTIEGLWLYRTASDWTAQQTITESVGVWIASSAYDVTVKGNRIENWGCAGVYHGGTSTSIAVLGNTIIGVGRAGGLVTASNYNFGVCFYLTSGQSITIEGNNFRELAQGIFVGPNHVNVTIVGNVVHNIVGQHGMYLDSGSNMTVTGNTVQNCAINGIKIQMQAAHTADAVGIAVSGNAVLDTGQAGILVVKGAGAAYYIKNIAITGNAVTDTGTDGIYVDIADGWSVVGNTIRNTGTFGIRVPSASVCRNGRIAGNVIHTTHDNAITGILQSSSYTCVVEDNLVLEPCQVGGQGGSPSSAVYLGTGTWIFRRNVIRASAIPPTYNIHFASTTYAQAYDNILPADRSNQVVAGAVVNALGPRSISADRGDNSVTLQVGVDSEVQRFATTLTANRTVTLSTTSATKGDRFRVVRSGLGDFTLAVGSLKTIPSGTAAWVDVEYSGTAWVLTGYGTL